MLITKLVKSKIDVRDSLEGLRNGVLTLKELVE